MPPELFLLFLFVLFPGPKSQIVTIVFRIGLPQKAQQWRLELLAPVPPVGIDQLDEVLRVVDGEDEAILPFNQSPEFLIGVFGENGGVLTRQELQFRDGPFEEVDCQDLLAAVQVFVLVSKHEDVVHLAQLVFVDFG
jgi:hypothetical protein